MNRIIHPSASESSRTHQVVFNQECDYYDRINTLCSVGQGICLNKGKKEECKVIRYYQEKLNSVKPKTFIERFQAENYEELRRRL